MSRWCALGCLLASAAAVAGMGLGGCSCGSETAICDDDGCRVCDAYGCRPSTPHADGSGGASGAGGTEAGGSGADVFTEPTCDPSTALCPCDEEGACDDGLACIGGACMVPCEYSSQCGASRICVNGQCVVGCDADVPCPKGYTCSDLGTCQPNPNDSECGASKSCVGGLVCVEGTCHAGCQTTDECAQGEVCNGANGTCMTDPQPARPCAVDPDVCNDNQVCDGGYCRYACEDDDSCRKTDARIAVCKDGICMSEAEANPECTQQKDCPAGAACVSNVCK